MTDRIELRGLRALGCHGVLEEERGRAQPFEVDLDLELDLRAAGRTDALADTVDYGAVAKAVQQIVAGEHADLLEHLAQRIAAAVLTAPDVSAVTGDHALTRNPAATSGPTVTGGPTVIGVTVAIRKLRPPLPVDLSSAGVRIHRRREDLE